MTNDTAQTLQVILVAAALVVGALAIFLWRRLGLTFAWADLTTGFAQDERTSDTAHVAPIVQQRPAERAQEAPAVSFRLAPVDLAPLRAVVIQLLQKAPHIGIIGKTGDGKTTTGEAIIRMLKGEGFVVDPKWWRGKWGGLPAAGLDDNAGYTQIATGLRTVFAEFNRRRIHKRDNPEATFSDLWLIWDEINDTMEEVPDAGVPLRRLLRVGREYNVHVLFFPQSDRVGALGLEGHGDAVDNVLWIHLGADARKVVKRLVESKKMSAEVGQYMTTMPRPCVVAHGGRHYAVDLSAAPDLAVGPLSSLSGWEPLSLSLSEPAGPVAERAAGVNSDSDSADSGGRLSERRIKAVRRAVKAGMSRTLIIDLLGISPNKGYALLDEILGSENALQPETAGAAVAA